MSRRHTRLPAALATALALGALAVPAPAHAFNTFYPTECGGGAFWTTQPSPWHLHTDGYSPMTQAQLQTTLDSAWAVWSQPCCTDWSVAYQGTASAGAISTDTRNIVEFEETAWPPTLGTVNSTIAVTLPAVYSDCTIRRADMLFNGVGFDFIDGDPSTSGKADLMSIAVHEMGHWLGLDHSDVQGSSLWWSYSGGTGERSLHQDDIDAVCFLYPQTCSGTTPPPPPPTGEPCGSATCATGEVCDPATLTCLPTAGCPGLGNMCDTSGGDCTSANDVCLSEDGASYFCSCYCTSDADCGAGATCLALGNGSSACVDTALLDPCFGVSCASGEACNPQTGACEATAPPPPPPPPEDTSVGEEDTAPDADIAEDTAADTSAPDAGHDDTAEDTTATADDAVGSGSDVSDASRDTAGGSDTSSALGDTADARDGADAGTSPDTSAGDTHTDATLEGEPLPDPTTDCACSSLRATGQDSPRPLPLTLGLAGLALGALVHRRRRRR